MRGQNGSALFSQSGGVANVSSDIDIGCDANSSCPAVVDISGGTLTHTARAYVMNTGGAIPANGYGNVTGYGVLSVRGSGYFQEQTGNFS